MFEGQLCDKDGNPIEFYVDDPQSGRRVPVALRLRGPQVLAVSSERAEEGEPIVSEIESPPTDRLRAPFDADDFTEPAAPVEGSGPRAA